MEDVLREFNLTNNEIKIYLALLSQGLALAGEITTITGIHRRNVYDSIERLVKKGLVGYITRNNRKYFRAADPHHFFYLIELEKKSLRQREKQLRRVLPQLLVSQTAVKDVQKITVYEGKKGIITILEDIIATGKANLAYAAPEIGIIKNYLKWFHRKRVKAGIPDKLILNSKEVRRARMLARMPHTEVRVMKRGFDSPIAVNVYSDKVGILILAGNPLGILIQDRLVSESFRKYFGLLWDVAQKV